MLDNAAGFSHVYLAVGRTDLRKGIDGLAAIVKSQFHLDPFQKDVLFLFCGRSPTRLKGLVWEGDGFLQLYKRCEAGHYQWPRTVEEARTMEISQEQLSDLMKGLTVVQKCTIRKEIHPSAPA